jgi:hypothetical protein
MIIPRSFLTESYGEAIREWVLNNAKIIKITDYLGISVFKDASVINCIPVLEKSPGDSRERNQVHIWRVRDDETYPIAQSVFFDTPQYAFRIELTPNAVSLMERLASNSIRVGDICYVSYSIAAHSEVENKGKDAYLFPKPINEKCEPFIEGKEIERYSIDWQGRYLEYDADILRRPSLPELFERPKITVVGISGTLGISAAFDQEGFYVGYPAICITLKHHLVDVERSDIHFSREAINKSLPFSLKYLLSIMNSRLMKFYFDKLIFSTSQTIYSDDIRQIPIRRIDFTTPADEREALLGEAKTLYEQALADKPSRTTHHAPRPPLLAFVDAQLVAEPERADVVHDLLAHLAEQMIALHQEKQARTEAFWLDLEGVTAADTFEDLREHGKWESSLWKAEACRPFVDEESRSTRHLNESLAWTEDCFKAFVKLLAGRVPNLSDVVGVYRRHHPEVKALAQRIETTDWLIDQIVYRLYGLTEEEIAVVEGRA